MKRPIYQDSMNLTLDRIILYPSWRAAIPATTHNELPMAWMQALAHMSRADFTELMEEGNILVVTLEH